MGRTAMLKRTSPCPATSFLFLEASPASPTTCLVSPIKRTLGDPSTTANQRMTHILPSSSLPNTVHPRTSKMKRDAGKKKTHRRNQSSLSSHKEFSQRTKDRSMMKRVASSMSGFGHFSMSSHVGRTKNTKEEHRGD